MKLSNIKNIAISILVLLVGISCSNKLVSASNSAIALTKKKRCISNITTSNDSVIIYQLQMDTNLSKREYLRLHMYKTRKWIDDGQTLIGYSYCDSKMELDTTSFEPQINGHSMEFPNQEITGQIRNVESHWMHPPRSEYFKVLEMNAFPYYVKGKTEWNYVLEFGDYWGDKRWLTWSGRKESNSEYKVTGTVNYKFGQNTLKCTKIVANTSIPSLGNTKSVFYYNSNYGFVFMQFQTINNKLIELRMI